MAVVECLGIIGHFISPNLRGWVSSLLSLAPAWNLELGSNDDRSHFAERELLLANRTHGGQYLERLPLGSHSCPCVDTRRVRWLAI